MQFTYNNKIIEETLHYFHAEGTFELPKRLWDKNYATPFNVLKNWVLVGTFAIKSYKLTSDSIHLLEQEQFDEN